MGSSSLEMFTLEGAFKNIFLKFEIIRSTFGKFFPIDWA